MTKNKLSIKIAKTTPEEKELFKKAKKEIKERAKRMKAMICPTCNHLVWIEKRS